MKIVWMLMAALVPAPAGAASADYPVQPVPFTDVHFTGGMWQQRQSTNATVTLPFAMAQCVSSKRLQNFDLAAETLLRRRSGETNFQNKPVTIYPFDDSDVYKVLEGASFCLSVKPDPAIAAQADGFIRQVAAAQEPDGYLYTWRTMHPDSPAHEWIGTNRWEKDPILSHELYDLGHLYEAGAAHYQATGSRELLDVCLRSANLVQLDFGDGKNRIPPGHEVIEMGLVKLYRATGDPRWLALARLFLEFRGAPGGNTYNQNHIPVVEQSEAVGHAVRANYLYSGMADVAALTGDRRYLDAIQKIWTNAVGCKVHLTGGVGALANGEAYGADYELPNNCYNETCAAVGFLFWNHRMFLLSGQARYMDVFERTLYNGFLSGVSLSGDRFFYPNPLEWDGKSKFNHGTAGRAPWFGCACCPPNVLRLLASLGGYAYAVQDTNLFVNLYASSDSKAELRGQKVSVLQSTDYPWSGEVRLTVTPQREQTFCLCLRIPGWVNGKPLPSDLYHYEDATPASWKISINGKPVTAPVVDGYARLARAWKPGDRVDLSMAMPVRRVLGNPKIQATRGLVALERGPVVYCLEGVDNPGRLLNAVLPAGASIRVVPRPELLGGVTVLEIQDAKRVPVDPASKAPSQGLSLTAIPYATWNNRGASPMTVWMAEDPTAARQDF